MQTWDFLLPSPYCKNGSPQSPGKNGSPLNPSSFSPQNAGAVRKGFDVVPVPTAKIVPHDLNRSTVLYFAPEMWVAKRQGLTWLFPWFPCVRCYGRRHGPEGRGGRIGRRERFPQDVPSSGASLRSVSPGCGLVFAAHLQPLPAEAKTQPGAERVLLNTCSPF